MRPLVMRAAFVCALLVGVSCKGDFDEQQEREESGGLLKWIHSLLPSSLVGQNPYFCKWYDCPSFDVIAKNWLYETRSYPEVNWVTCQLPYREVSRLDFERARQVCFWALYNYISGGNTESKKINMAVPVVERFSNNTLPFMGFFIPGSTDDVPTPNNPNLTVVVQPPASYYVRSFSGYGYNTLTGTDNWAIQTYILKRALQKDGKTWGESLTAAGYDNPWNPFFRHNEVWLDVDANTV